MMATMVDPIMNFTEDGAANGSLFTLNPGTSWPSGAKFAYSDKPCANALPNPITLSANGQPTVAGGAITPVYGKGQYKLLLVAAGGNYTAPIWTVDNVDLLGSSTLTTIGTYNNSLNTAVSTIGANAAYVIVDATANITANNLTVPATTSIQVLQGGSVALGGFNVAFNGPFTAGGYRVFTGSGNATFGANALPAGPNPAWWGGGAGGAANASNSWSVPSLPGGVTPDVSTAYFLYRTANNGAITNFANGGAGQSFWLVANDSNTSVTLGTNILGLGGTTGTVSLITGDLAQLIFDGTKWHYLGATGSSTTMYRNRLINGEMRIDQRNNGNSNTVANGATLTPASLTYTVDRWGVAATGANVTAQQVAGAGQFKNYLQISGASSVTGVSVAQRIESINILDQANSTVALSVYLATTAANANVTWTAYTPPASNDTWTGNDTQVVTGTFAANANMTRYSTTIPLTANATRGLEVVLSLGALTGGLIWTLTGCQLEAGPISSVFERRPDDIELMRCWRYLPGCRSTSTGYAGPFTGVGVGANVAYFTVPLPVTPRTGITNPTVANVANCWEVYLANGSSYNVPVSYLGFAGFGGFNLNAILVSLNANGLATIPANAPAWLVANYSAANGNQAYVFGNAEL